MKKQRKLKTLWVVAIIDIVLTVACFTTFLILLINILNKLDPGVDANFGFYNVLTYMFLVVAVILLINFLTLMRFIGRAKNQVVKEKLINDNKIEK